MKSNKSNAPVSRRDSLKYLAMAGLALGFPAGAASATAASTGALSPAGPFYLPPLPPLQPGPGGLDIRTWVRSDRTNGQFSCVESAVAARQMGPPPHVHAELDELMFVLEGTASVWMAGKVEEIRAGGWHFRPRKIEHTFWNAGNQPLRFIDMYFNQNFEDFLEELFHQIIPDMVQRRLTPADPGIARRLADLDARFGVTTFPEKRQPLVEQYGLKP